MKIENPFKKNDRSPHRSKITIEKPKEKSKEKKDWFGFSLIAYTGIMIGALVVYILVTFT
mgnify:CR=1 FL=1